MIKPQETNILIEIQHSKIKFNYKQTVSYEMSTKAQKAACNTNHTYKSIYCYYCNWPL